MSSQRADPGRQYLGAPYQAYQATVEKLFGGSLQNVKMGFAQENFLKSDNSLSSFDDAGAARDEKIMK